MDNRNKTLPKAQRTQRTGSFNDLSSKQKLQQASRSRPNFSASESQPKFSFKISTKLQLAKIHKVRQGCMTLERLQESSWPGPQHCPAVLIIFARRGGTARVFHGAGQGHIISYIISDVSFISEKYILSIDFLL